MDAAEGSRIFGLCYDDDPSSILAAIAVTTDKKIGGCALIQKLTTRTVLFPCIIKSFYHNHHIFVKLQRSITELLT